MNDESDTLAFFLMRRASTTFFGGNKWWDTFIKLASRVAPLVFAPRRIMIAFEVQVLREIQRLTVTTQYRLRTYCVVA